MGFSYRFVLVANTDYSPTTGRFLTEDPHWNTSNNIYGDNPVQIGERQDPLGVNIYTYRPNINAISQSTNLYVYCMNNPIIYTDPSGKFIPALPAIPFLLEALFSFGATVATVMAIDHTIQTKSQVMDLREETIVGAESAIIAQTIAQTKRDESTLIYRFGDNSNYNLTPREIDTAGLSYSSVMPTDGRDFTVTTMELINSTGVLTAVKDGGTHVSVRPTNMSTMPDWIASKKGSKKNPHPYTSVLKGISAYVPKATQ